MIPNLMTEQDCLETVNLSAFNYPEASSPSQHRGLHLLNNEFYTFSILSLTPSSTHALNGKAPTNLQHRSKIARFIPLFAIAAIAIVMSNPMAFLRQLLRPFHSAASGLTPEQAVSASNLPANAQKCTVAAGCFWGVEHLYRKNFGGRGLLDAQVGYIGGNTDNPGYRAVCSGATGHAEALQVTFDPDQVSYRSLIEFFYKMHDPTTKNRQGMDAGTQYRSGIFYHSTEQKSIAEQVTKQAQEQWWKAGTISTEILPAGTWWTAEQYHQLYLHNNPGGYECPAHHVRSFPPLQ